MHLLLEIDFQCFQVFEGDNLSHGDHLVAATAPRVHKEAVLELSGDKHKVVIAAYGILLNALVRQVDAMVELL
jgi:hypothetical protein